jgi:uncharacterized DUF497 family protein
MIERLVRRRDNVAKLATHGIRWEEVQEMVDLDEYAFFDSDYSGQVRVVGPTASGRLITVAMEDMGNGTFRPISGWDSVRSERQRYHEEA